MKVETSAVIRPYPPQGAIAQRSHSTLAKAPPVALLQANADSSRKSPFEMMKGISQDLNAGGRYQGFKASRAKNRQALNYAMNGVVNNAYNPGKSDVSRMSQNSADKRPITQEFSVRGISHDRSNSMVEQRQARLSALNIKVKQMLRQDKSRDSSRSSDVLRGLRAENIAMGKPLIPNPYQSQDNSKVEAMMIQQNLEALGGPSFKMRSRTPYQNSRVNNRISESQATSQRRMVNSFAADAEPNIQALMNQTDRQGQTRSALSVADYSNKKIHTGGMSVQEYVRSSFKDNKGAQSELNYYPNERALQKNILLWKQMPPKESFLDPIIKIEKKKLGPQAYATHSNWNDAQSNSYQNGHAKKGVFQPRERPLVTKEFMAEAKRRDIPPPGAYNLPKSDKPLLGHSDKAEKSSSHIDSAVYQAKQTPAVCYKTVDQLVTPAVRPRVKATKIYEPKVKREDLGKKPKKDSGPDMGSYNSKHGFEYTQKRGFHSQKWDTGPVVKFYEMTVKQSKKVPPPNHYKVTKEMYDRISKSPPSIRMRRH